MVATDLAYTSKVALSEYLEELVTSGFINKQSQLIISSLNIKPEDIVADNPYFQRKNLKQNGCQIDYLIQTKFNNLYICEIKADVINAVQKKIHDLKCPKNFAKIPVLIHAGTLVDTVYDKDYFVKIIDFGAYLSDIEKKATS